MRSRVLTSRVLLCQTAIDDLKNNLSSEDVEVLKEKTQALSQASMKIGEAINKSGEQSQSSSSDSGSEGEKKP